MANRENSREQDELSQSTEVEETYFEDSDTRILNMRSTTSTRITTMRKRTPPFFAMSEEELDDRPGVNWLSVLSAAVAVILSIILAVVGVRAFCVGE